MSKWAEDALYKCIEFMFYMVIIYVTSYFSKIDVNTIAMWYMFMILIDIRLEAKKDHKDAN